MNTKERTANRRHATAAMEHRWRRKLSLNSVASRRMILAGIAALLLSIPVGCATKSPRKASLPAPLSETVRAELGTIGLIERGPGTNLFFRTPRTKAAAAGLGALGGFIWGLGAGAEAGKGGGEMGGAVALMVWCVTVPAGTIVGAISGQAAGEPAAVLVKSQQELRSAILNMDLQRMITREIEWTACDRAQREFVLLAGCESEVPGGPATQAGLTSRAIDTILEIDVRSAGLCGHASREKTAPLSAFLQVSARLVRVRDGAELYARTWVCEEGSRTFVEWAENHGEPLRHELAGMPAQLADSIIDELFCR